MACFEKIPIIGIGDSGFEGLTASARKSIEQADLLIGSETQLRLVPDSSAKRFVVGGNLADTIECIEASGGKQIAVVASGDPLFYGIARYLCDKLGKDRFEVIPHVSSMQLAFARVKESWEDAYLTDLANRPMQRVLDAVRVADKVGLFTSETCTPAVVAQKLLDQGIDYFSAYVCENLGSPDERVTQGALAEIADQVFAPLNVMILVRDSNMPDQPCETRRQRLFGNSEDAFLQTSPKHGLLTPAEIRVIALAQMELRPKSIVWDVGAGCGSVAIEAAQIASEGTTYAIERDPEDHQLIVANAKRFGVNNLVPVLGAAPDAWQELPAPESIFVGGSGREVCSLVEMAFERLQPGGRIIASVGSIQNISAVYDALQSRSSDVRVWMINLARGTHQLERIRFEAINPIFLIAASKPA